MDPGSVRAWDQSGPGTRPCLGPVRAWDPSVPGTRPCLGPARAWDPSVPKTRPGLGSVRGWALHPAAERAHRESNKSRPCRQNNCSVTSAFASQGVIILGACILTQPSGLPEAGFWAVLRLKLQNPKSSLPRRGVTKFLVLREPQQVEPLHSYPAFISYLETTDRRPRPTRTKRHCVSDAKAPSSIIWQPQDVGFRKTAELESYKQFAGQFQRT